MFLHLTIYIYIPPPTPTKPKQRSSEAAKQRSSKAAQWFSAAASRRKPAARCGVALGTRRTKSLARVVEQDAGGTATATYAHIYLILSDARGSRRTGHLAIVLRLAESSVATTWDKTSPNAPSLLASTAATAITVYVAATYHRTR